MLETTGTTMHYLTDETRFGGKHYDPMKTYTLVFNQPYLVRSRLCYSVASVCRLSVCTERIVAKRCALEQKLLWQLIWEIDWYLNEWHWPSFRGRIKVMPLRDIRRWISRKPLELEAWFQRTTNRNPFHLSNGHVIDDVAWPWKVKLVTPIRQCNISKTAGDIETPFQRTTSRKWYIGYQMVTWPMTSRDPEMCCEAIDYPSDSLASCSSWRQHVQRRLFCLFMCCRQQRPHGSPPSSFFSITNIFLLLILDLKSTKIFCRQI